jgi:transposase
MFVMSHPPYLRAKARELRTERRLTIDEIAERLALSRTTIYHWVRDLAPIERSGRPATAGQLKGKPGHADQAQTGARGGIPAGTDHL